MDDEQILDLYFARDEQAVAETDRKYGGYCITAHIPPGKPENNATGPDVVAFWTAICYNSQKRGEKVSL